MWPEKNSKSKSLQIFVKETYAAGKLASAKTISSPWPILAKVWSKSGDKMTGIPFKRPIFFNAENSCFFGGSVYLLVRNAMIVHLFTQPSHENYQNFQNSEFFKYKK